MKSPQQGEGSSASIQGNNTVGSPDGLRFILQDTLPQKEENIICSLVLKSFELIKINVMPAFVASQYVVKSSCFNY